MVINNKSYNNKNSEKKNKKKKENQVSWACTEKRREIGPVNIPARIFELVPSGVLRQSRLPQSRPRRCPPAPRRLPRSCPLRPSPNPSPRRLLPLLPSSPKSGPSQAPRSPAVAARRLLGARRRPRHPGPWPLPRGRTAKSATASPLPLH